MGVQLELVSLLHMGNMNSFCEKGIKDNLQGNLYRGDNIDINKLKTKVRV
jgi:hypothetical protein